MALGDDEVIACGCGFDDVSFPHDCKTGKEYTTHNFAKLEFFDWLEKVIYLLPPKMSIHEARILFERKSREEKELEGLDERRDD